MRWARHDNANLTVPTILLPSSTRQQEKAAAQPALFLSPHYFFHDPSVRSGWPARYGMVPFDTTIFLSNFLL